MALVTFCFGSAFGMVINALAGQTFVQLWHKIHSVAFLRLRESLQTSTYGNDLEHQKHNDGGTVLSHIRILCYVASGMSLQRVV